MASDEQPNKKPLNPRATIWEISSEIGVDVRELIMSGYSDAQIDRVRRGEITLQQLSAEKPEGNPRGQRRPRPTDTSD